MNTTQRAIILQEIAQTLNQSHRVATVMDSVLATVLTLLDLRSAWAFSYDASKMQYSLLGHAGLPPGLATGECHALCHGWCECQEEFAEQTLDRAINVVRCSRLDRCAGDRQGLVFHASVPLRGEQTPLGILNVAVAGVEKFEDDFLALLGSIGHQVAMALEREAVTIRLRERGNQLRDLIPLGQFLTTLDTEGAMMEAVIGFAVTQLHYPAAGIVNSATQIVIRARVEDAQPHAPVYGYRSRQEDESIRRALQGCLLDDPGSVICVPIAATMPLLLCAESPWIGAFDDTDIQVITALSAYLSAALDGLALRREAAAAAAWKERRALAADLHDSVNQRLFSASLLVQSALLALSARDHPKAEKTLSHLATLIGDSLQEVRAVVSTLREPSRDLIAYLEEQCITLRTMGLDVCTELAVPTLTCAPDAYDRLRRIVDEALQNVMRHAQASHLRVALQIDGDVVHLQIEDDGRGFADVDAEPPAPTGMGLANMRARAREIDGECTVITVPERGTTVTVAWPLVLGKGGAYHA